jgi:hypothetical protein
MRGHGPVANIPGAVAVAPFRIRLRILILAKRDVAWTELDPGAVHRFHEPSPRERDAPIDLRLPVPGALPNAAAARR